MNRKIMVAVLVAVLVIAVGIAVYFVVSRQTTVAEVRVLPESVTQAVGSDFAVNVSVSGISDLVGWELKFTWNSSVLGLVGVMEGGFLKSGGETYFSYNNTASHLLVDCALLGNVTGVSGEGVFVSIQMRVKDQGSCDLVLYDVQLINFSEQKIDATVSIGHFSSSS